MANQRGRGLVGLALAWLARRLVAQVGKRRHADPFSIAGVSKKLSLGRLHGFDDVKQGNLFFSLADILDFHHLGAFVLENVKNLKGHTFDIIHR